MEDCCAVCAEPLEWLAYAACGHKDACSKCVARLRFVLQDKRCVICQQQSPAVVITRNLGSFTSFFQPADFSGLRSKVELGELHYLPSAEAFFDNKAHLEEIRELCSYTHPVLASDGHRPKFRSLRELESVIKSSRQLQFCNICVSGRKVFISEQILYSDADLHRHMRTGDLVGPMAESGFPGHPQCRFCRKRFFGDNEIFTHMQQKHEHCFLCRRARPDKHIYYRDYQELEEHFQREHFACEHASCLEAKFVVFGTEPELKQHQGKEHGSNMSRAERRQALSVPVHLQFRNEEEARAGPSGQGITIGGPNSTLARFQPRHNDARNLAAATQASLASARSDAARRDAQGSQDTARGRQGNGGHQQPEDSDFNLLRDGDFPAAMAGAAGAPAPAGRWAGAVGAGPHSGLRAEDFPSLPGTSKASKKKARQKDKEHQQQAASIAERTRPGEVRVLNRPSAQPQGTADRSIRQLQAASSGELPAQEATGPASQEVQPPSPSPLAARRRSAGFSPAPHRSAQPLPGPSSQAAADAAAVSAKHHEAPRWPGAAAVPSAHSGGAANLDTAFPVLGAGGRTASSAQWAARRQPTAPTPPLDAQAQARQREADFPVLGRLPQRPASRAAAMQQGNGAAAAAPSGGASDAVKAAHRELLDKVRRQIDEELLADFKTLSGLFFQGQLDPQNYHEYVISLGLALLVPEIASLMPDAVKRNDLLAAYRAAFASGSSLLGDEPQPFVPPEAALAAANAAENRSIWQCGACTLMNASMELKCAACSQPKPAADTSHKQQQAEEQVPKRAADRFSKQQQAELQGSSSSKQASTGGQTNAAAHKQKHKKVPKFDRLRVTGGDSHATQDWLEANGAVPVRPQNAWTHNRSSADALKQPGPSSGASKPPPVRNGWAAQPGRLAQQVSATQKAWAKH